MATVTVVGDTVEVLFTFPLAQATAFRDDLREIYNLPEATNDELANRIAETIRERIRAYRREKASENASETDPGTVDFQ